MTVKDIEEIEGLDPLEVGYIHNPDSRQLKEFIDASQKGVYAQYCDHGIAFFFREKYTIDEIHNILGTRAEVRPLCMIINHSYKIQYTDKYDGIGVRNLTELAYMYNYLKKYRFLDQKFINNVHSGLKYIIDIRDNHPKRQEAAQIIGDHPLLRKLFRGAVVAIKVLIPIAAAIGMWLLKRKYHIGENMNNQYLIESLDYHLNEVSVNLWKKAAGLKRNKKLIKSLDAISSIVKRDIKK